MLLFWQLLEEQTSHCHSLVEDIKVTKDIAKVSSKIVFARQKWLSAFIIREHQGQPYQYVQRLYYHSNTKPLIVTASSKILKSPRTSQRSVQRQYFPSKKQAICLYNNHLKGALGTAILVCSEVILSLKTKPVIVTASSKISKSPRTSQRSVQRQYT